MNANPTVELVLCKLKPGVSEQAYIQANRDIEPIVAAMPGFLKMDLLKTNDGYWVGMVHWATAENALQAAQQFPQMPEAQPLEAMLDVNTVQMFHLHSV